MSELVYADIFSDVYTFILTFDEQLLAIFLFIHEECDLLSVIYFSIVMAISYFFTLEGCM